MGKVLIIVVILLLCCCLTSVGGFVALGSLELNGKCAYRGPFGSDVGNACDKVMDLDESNNNDNSNNTNDVDSDNNDHGDDQVYAGDNSDEYTFYYPDDFSIDEDSNPGFTFVYAHDTRDNLNITTDASITVSSSNCESYATATVDSLYTYDAEFIDSGVVTIDGIRSCKAEFSADYGNGIVEQTQYYVPSGSKSYILTITINEDATNFAPLNKVALSFEVK